MELLIAAAVIALIVGIVIGMRSAKNDKAGGSGGGINRDEVEK